MRHKTLDLSTELICSDEGVKTLETSVFNLFTEVNLRYQLS